MTSRMERLARRPDARAASSPASSNATPAAPTSWTLGYSGFSVSWDGTTVQFLFDSVLWSVTAAEYASADGENPPSLMVTMENPQQPPSQNVAITLSNARFPGTAINADFSFSSVYAFDPTTGESSNALSLLWLGASDSVGIGYQGTIYAYPVTGVVTANTTLPAGGIAALGTAGSLVYEPGAAVAVQFKPGMLQLAGPGAFGFTGIFAEFTADTLTVDSATLDDFGGDFDDPPALGSLVTLTSQAGWWPPLWDGTTAIGLLTAAAPSFDTFSFATGESGTGVPAQQRAYFDTTSTAVQFSLALDNSVAAPIGPAPTVSLWQPELGFDLTLAQPLVGMSAKAFAPTTFWAGGDGVWLRIPASAPDANNPGNADLGPIAAQAGWPTAVSLLYDMMALGADGAMLQPSGGVCVFSAVPLSWNSIMVGAAAGPRVLLSEVTLDLVRPADLLVLKLTYAGMMLQSVTGGVPILGLALSTQPGSVRVSLPPQHIAEAVVEPGAALGAQPIPIVMTGGSTLFFTVPAGTASFPADVAHLLDWSALLPVVVGAAPYPNPASPVEPNINQTGLELPYRMIVSPGAQAGWSPSVPPDASGEGTAALWHTRIAALAPGSEGPFVDERPTAANRAAWRMAAVWSPDWPTPAPDALDGALKAAERAAIVNNCAINGAPTIVPLEVNHCVLSALGAWTDFAADWSDNPAASVTAWRQVAAQGRDQFVRVVLRGHLFPWGHAANWVRVSERRFSGDGFNSAWLYETDYIVITKPVQDYGKLAGMPTGGRDLPYTRIEALTLTTPPIASQAQSAISSDGNLTGAFWVSLPDGQTRFQFHFRGYDRNVSGAAEGQHSSFYGPAIFIGSGSSGPAASMGSAARGDTLQPLDALDPYVSAAQAAFDPVMTANPLQLGGQALAYAAQTLPGDTSHPTAALALITGDARQGAASWLQGNGEAAFYPTMQSALVSLPAAQALAGVAAGNVAISYAQNYLADEFNNNAAELYAQLATPIAAVFSGPQANGLVAADMTLGALTRKNGLLPNSGTTASLASLAAGTLDPTDFLAGTANLIGIINLKSLLTEVIDLAQAAGDKIPGFQSNSTPTEVTLTFDWVYDQVPQVLVVEFPPDANGNAVGTFELHISLVEPIVGPGQPPAEPVATTVATLSAFTLNFAGLVLVGFSGLSFTSVTGAKPEVKVPFTGIALTGQIDFLEPIIEAGQALLGEVPSIAMLPDSITIEQDVGLPEIGFGVFDLSNIRVNTGLVLSLQSDPMTLEFGFSDRTHPFTLAIDLLGGGGWFHIAFQGADVSEIDFGVQAGACASLDLGVASGSVSIMIGVSFTYTGGEDMLTGYVRACGELTVLQLISVSVEFYMGLTYVVGSGHIWGEADLTIEISIAFFSKSVTLTLRKEFPVSISTDSLARQLDGRISPVASSPQPPKVIDVMPQAADWQAYAAAFA